MTANHYCTDAMKNELDWLRVPIQRHRTPTTESCFQLPRCYPEDCGVEEVHMGFNRDTAYVCRSENSTEVSQADRRSCLRREASRLQHYLHIQPFLMQATC